MSLLLAFRPPKATLEFCRRALLCSSAELIYIYKYLYYTMPRYVFIMQEFAVLRNKLRSMILLLRKS